MKLVAARCPNCNANLDVNPNNETMKCQYCGGAILVDDAIAKYKLEISGEIEVKNLPKVDNYLKIADRHYNLKDYSEAYKNYEKIIELEPNNKIALLRYGICKTLLNNYIDFPLDYLKNSFDEVVKLSTEDKTYTQNIELYVKETVSAIDDYLYALRKYYNSYAVNGSDLIEIQKKLLSIVYIYEDVLLHTNIYKTHILEQLISVLKDIIKDKSYKTGTSIEGGNFYKSYKTSFETKSVLIEKLNYYQNMLNPSSEYQDNNKTTNYTDGLERKSSNTVTGSIIAIDIFLGMLILGSMMNGYIVSSLIMIFIFLIITFNNISETIFKGNNKKKKYCIIGLIIFLLMTMANGI